MFGRSLRAVLGWLRSSPPWQLEAVSLLSRLASLSRATPNASITWARSSLFSSARASLSSLVTWGSGHMNFLIPPWVKALVLVLLITGAFGGGVVWEAERSQAAILAQARQEREALASALTAKMAEMQVAAVKLATERSEREKNAEAAAQTAIQEAQDAIEGAKTNVPSCNLPVGAVRSLNRLRKQPEVVQPKQRSLLAPFRSSGAGRPAAAAP
jgi:hypothetical protein